LNIHKLLRVRTAGDLQPLIGLLDIHSLSVEDALDTNQLPKIDDFPDSTVIVFNAFSYIENTLSVQEIDLFLSNHFLISVDRIGPDGKPLLDGIEEMVQREMDTDRLGPAFVMHTILDVMSLPCFTLTSYIPSIPTYYIPPNKIITFFLIKQLHYS